MEILLTLIIASICIFFTIEVSKEYTILKPDEAFKISAIIIAIIIVMTVLRLITIVVSKLGKAI